ncbi:MAG TPA: hypothetical protein VKW04_24885, partial [Planctomycetota bacterium]|nr:hypothetical protein [Planctomycetota bacterium]
FQDPERTPPFPPAVAGGDEPEPTPATPEEARALALSVLGPKADPLTEREIKTMVSEAARFGAEQRTPLYRRERRRVRDWILAHVPLDEVKRRIAEGWLLQ